MENGFLLNLLFPPSMSLRAPHQHPNNHRPLDIFLGQRTLSSPTPHPLWQSQSRTDVPKQRAEIQSEAFSGCLLGVLCLTGSGVPSG